jgi:hypothetical protein
MDVSVEQRRCRRELGILFHGYFVAPIGCRRVRFAETVVDAGRNYNLARRGTEIVVLAVRR